MAKINSSAAKSQSRTQRTQQSQRPQKTTPTQTSQTTDKTRSKDQVDISCEVKAKSNDKCGADDLLKGIEDWGKGCQGKKKSGGCGGGKKNSGGCGGGQKAGGGGGGQKAGGCGGGKKSGGCGDKGDGGGDWNSKIQKDIEAVKKSQGKEKQGATMQLAMDYVGAQIQGAKLDDGLAKEAEALLGGGGGGKKKAA